jgi:hypothetical protein
VDSEVVFDSNESAFRVSFVPKSKSMKSFQVTFSVHCLKNITFSEQVVPSPKIQFVTKL